MSSVYLYEWNQSLVCICHKVYRVKVQIPYYSHNPSKLMKRPLYVPKLLLMKMATYCTKWSGVYVKNRLLNLICSFSLYVCKFTCFHLISLKYQYHIIIIYWGGCVMKVFITFPLKCQPSLIRRFLLIIGWLYFYYRTKVTNHPYWYLVRLPAEDRAW